MSDATLLVDPLNAHTSLKGFTLKSPWLASAMLHGQKVIENRSQDWSSGWYAVHVGVGAEDPWCEQHVRENVTDQTCMTIIENDIRDGLVPRGHVIGLVHIQYTLPVTEAKQSTASGWAIGPFCMVISHRVFLRNPVKMRGQLGAWHVNGGVHESVVEQLGNAIGQCGTIGVLQNGRTLKLYKEKLLLEKREQRLLKKAVKRGRDACSNDGKQSQTQTLVQARLVGFSK